MLRSFSLIGCALLAACSASPDDPAASSGSSESAGPAPLVPPSASAGAELTDTIVTIHVDGRVEQSTRTATAEQRQREAELHTKPSTNGVDEAVVDGDSSSADASARRLLTLRTNSSCAGSDLWIYDTTMANRICITAVNLGYNTVDQIDLGTINYGFACLAIDIYGRCTQRAKWAGEVGYIWPGSNEGRLYLDPNTFTGYFSSWGPFQAVDPARTSIVVFDGPRLN
ncbi:MAG TPA: hypothetical protein VIV60_36895 [Polyangiaceae bacterium]